MGEAEVIMDQEHQQVDLITEPIVITIEHQDLTQPGAITNQTSRTELVEEHQDQVVLLQELHVHHQDTEAQVHVQEAEDSVNNYQPRILKSCII